MVCSEQHNPSQFWKAVFHKFYLVHSWILCLIYSSPILKLLSFLAHHCFWSNLFEKEKSSHNFVISLFFTTATGLRAWKWILPSLFVSRSWIKHSLKQLCFKTFSQLYSVRLYLEQNKEELNQLTRQKK